MRRRSEFGFGAGAGFSFSALDLVRGEEGRVFGGWVVGWLGGLVAGWLSLWGGWMVE